MFLGAFNSTEYLVCPYSSPTMAMNSLSSKAVVGKKKKSEWGLKRILMRKRMAKCRSCFMYTFQFLCFVKTCEISVIKGFRSFRRQRLKFCFTGFRFEAIVGLCRFKSLVRGE